MNRSLIAAAVLSLLAPAASLADPAPPPAETAAAPAKEPLICKAGMHQGAPTRVPVKKVCLTKGEWERIRRDGHDATEEATRSSLRNNCSSAFQNGGGC